MESQQCQVYDFSLNEFENRISHLELLLKTAKDESKSKDETISILKAEIEVLRKESIELKKEVNKHVEAHFTTEAYYSNLIAGLNVDNRNLENLSNALVIYKDAMKEQEIKFRGLKESIENISIEKEELSYENELLKVQMETLQDRLNVQSRLMTKSKEEFSFALDENLKIKGHLSSHIRDLEIQIGAAESNISKLKKKNELLSTQNVIIQGEDKQKVQEILLLKAEINKLTESLERKQAESNEGIGALSDRIKELESLILNFSNKAETDKEVQRKKIEDMETELRLKINENQRLQARIKAVEAEDSKASQLFNTFDFLSIFGKDLGVHEEKLRYLYEKFLLYRIRYINMKQILYNWKSYLAKVMPMLQEKQINYKDLIKKSQNLEGLNTSMQEKLKETMKTNEGLNKKYKDLLLKHENLNQDLSSLAIQIRRCLFQNSKLKNIIKSHNLEYEIFSEDNMNNEDKNMYQDLEELIELNKALKDRLTQLSATSYRGMTRAY